MLTHSTLRPEHPIPRSLAELAREFRLETWKRGSATRGDLDQVEISGVSLDSRDIADGDLYVGLAGARSHGAAFAAQARDAGAVAVLTDEAGAPLAEDSGLPVLITADPRAALGEVSAWVYRSTEDPPVLFSVTGTNGKTSVVYLIEAVLRQLGVRTGLSSTAERRAGDDTVVAGLTTPEASELHALLARMRENAVRAAAIEVSAQAVSRGRVGGVVFDVVGFTNLSHDHLDDYLDMDEYFEAKRALFDPDRARRAVVTVDSDWGRRLAEESRVPVTTLASGSVTEADWHVVVTEENRHSTAFTLSGPGGESIATSVPLFGWYMAANAALALLMLVEAGYEPEEIQHVLDRDGGIDVYIPGRAERVSGDDGPTVYIDYGHTPDAFLNTLDALRPLTPGKVIMVFGADGDRDKTKRDDMGAIAARGADVVVITDFHPRFEDPAEIRAALLAGARRAVPDREIHEVPDPREALRLAVALSRPGDTILYAGPGHEDYQEISGVKHPYSARDDARLALREAGWDGGDA
ncbi:Mur ligase family protein [Herbiconiux sp. L3-i23]|uniref:Mur ligase family protein n=1 Tax=Herbiconiux sp. L3-i23 TaxID=2905871 RepID=UPI002067ACD5|nr:UDP-N-acetylmuramoyl-L-alanyl-D-glutamate--2,6-diaminopimelate ligase [Herbiconiux sp. L3-i23]BDI22399.1 UDP-N-acetylmuramoyl-L-alanyl-D-glutamate--2,6-diaminopimelate ligase [Herbiconiux sp. L3-i23]